MSHAGCPGASAASGIDGAAATCQRVRAALGVLFASIRSNRGVTPDPSAARASRRLAVRSSAGGLPHNSITTTPSPVQRIASAPARSVVAASRSTPTITRAGSSPICARPAAWMAPPRRSAACSRSHSTCPPSNRASAMPNPAALPPSPPSAVNTSCSRAAGRPPSSNRSIARCPVDLQAEPCTGPCTGSPRAAPPRRSISAIRRLSNPSESMAICSLNVPTGTKSQTPFTLRPCYSQERPAPRQKKSILASRSSVRSSRPAPWLMASECSS